MRTLLATVFIFLLATDLIPGVTETDGKIVLLTFLSISVILCFIQDIKELTCQHH